MLKWIATYSFIRECNLGKWIFTLELELLFCHFLFGYDVFEVILFGLSKDTFENWLTI